MADINLLSIRANWAQTFKEKITLISKDKDDKLKLFVFPDFEVAHILLNENLNWKISKLFNGYSLEKISESLITFCTKL